MNGRVGRFTTISVILLIDKINNQEHDPMDTFLDGNMSNIIFKRCLLQNQLSRRLRRLVQDM